jgi:hypothetical protein
MVLPLDTHTANALPTIHIECPHGYAMLSGDPRKKTGKKL